MFCLVYSEVFWTIWYCSKCYIELCITLDVVELCDGIFHWTAGIKVTDKRTVNPRDGSPLSSLDDEFGRIFNVQSRNYCFAVKSLLGKDNKDAYEEISDFFKFFWACAERGLSSIGVRSKDITSNSVEPTRLKYSLKVPQYGKWSMETWRYSFLPSLPMHR